jgi:hypothetical protein
MRFLTISSSLCKGLVLCFTLITLFSLQMPYYSYSSTNISGIDNTTIQLSNMSGNVTESSNVTSLSNLATNATISLTPNGSIVNLDLPESIVDLLGSEPPLADQQNTTGNLTVTNTTLVMTTNGTQLSGTENVTVSANFSSKPFGLETDYSISGKPIIIVNDVPLNYEYMNDPADEVTVSDMLVALRASIKLDNSTASLPEQLRIFSNPSNVTENSDGSRTYINDATTIDNLEIAGVIFSESTTIATIYPNGTGTLNSTNTQ